MGLDTTHDAWHGPYSSFMEWRIWLAKQIGIDLLKMEGFSDRDYTNPDREYGTVSWDLIEDNLKILLNHSDCGGELTVEECKKIEKRLSNIIKQVESKNEHSDRYLLNKTKQFRDGCKTAIKNNESIRFH